MLDGRPSRVERLEKNKDCPLPVKGISDAIYKSALMIRFMRESLNVLRKSGYSDIEDDSIKLLYSVVNNLFCEAVD